MITPKTHKTYTTYGENLMRVDGELVPPSHESTIQIRKTAKQSQTSR